MGVVRIGGAEEAGGAGGSRSTAVCNPHSLSLVFCMKFESPNVCSMCTALVIAGHNKLCAGAVSHVVGHDAQDHRHVLNERRQLELACLTIVQFII